MSTEENKTLTRRRFFEESLNQKRLTVLDEICASDYLFHNASLTTQGLEAYKQFISMYFVAFPDLHFTVDDIIAEGETVVVRVTARGTHQGSLMGIPPTGKQTSMTGMAILRYSNGRNVEQWFVGDNLGLLQQLGVVPAPGQASS